MGLLEDIRQDIADITTDADNGFAVELFLEAPTGETATINGTHAKHHLAIDQESGKQVNSKNANIAFSESVLTVLLYPVRINGEVNLKNHKVTVKDSTGTACTYKISEWFPDETVGLIVCILVDFV